MGLQDDVLAVGAHAFLSILNAALAAVFLFSGSAVRDFVAVLVRRRACRKSLASLVLLNVALATVVESVLKFEILYQFFVVIYPHIRFSTDAFCSAYLLA